MNLHVLVVYSVATHTANIRSVPGTTTFQPLSGQSDLFLGANKDYTYFNAGGRTKVEPFASSFGTS